MKKAIQKTILFRLWLNQESISLCQFISGVSVILGIGLFDHTPKEFRRQICERFVEHCKTRGYTRFANWLYVKFNRWIYED